MPAALPAAPASEPPHLPFSVVVDVVELKAMLADVQERLNALTRGAAECSHILTTEEAVRYAKTGSDSAFYRWAEKWAVTPASHGRWSRAALDMALNREAGLARTPATLKRRQSLSRQDAGKKPLSA